MQISVYCENKTIVTGVYENSFEHANPPIESSAVIEHKLYWSSVANENEGLYLASILNSETVRSRTAGLQSRGQWGARDFDKVVFTLPIPAFTPSITLHADLAKAAREAEAVAAAVSLPEKVKFQQARTLIRSALAAAGVASRIEGLVTQVLDG